MLMSKQKWTKEFVKQRLPAKIREIRRNQELPINEKPTHRWLNENGFSGIANYAKRRGKTIDDVLLNECGFEPKGPKDLGCHDAETRRLLNDWLRDEEDKFTRWNDTTLNDARSHIRKILKICQEELGTTALVNIARKEKGVRNKKLIKILAGLNKELEAEGARSNYATSMADFLSWLNITGEVDYEELDGYGDPVRPLLSRFGWSYDRNNPSHQLTCSQIRQMWEATQPINKDEIDDLEELRELYEEKILIISQAGLGWRPSDTSLVNVHTDISFRREDPYVLFGPERKNGPGKVAIVAGIDYLEEYVEILDELGYERLFPSEQSSDGTKSSQWIRNKISEIATRSGVTLPDGSKPTPKDLRGWWFNHHQEAVISYLNNVKISADDQASSSSEIVAAHYLTGKKSRDHFRQHVIDDFSHAFSTENVNTPKEIKRMRQSKGQDDQTRLDRFLALQPVIGQIWMACHATDERLQREIAAIEFDSRTSLPSQKRARLTMTGLLGLSTIVALVAAMVGINFAEPSMIPAELVITMILTLVLVIIDLPDLEEPPRDKTTI